LQNGRNLSIVLFALQAIGFQSPVSNSTKAYPLKPPRLPYYSTQLAKLYQTRTHTIRSWLDWVALRRYE
jgi:hypothetical protein